MHREPHMNDNHWNALVEFQGYIDELRFGVTRERANEIRHKANVCSDLMNYSHIVCRDFKQLDTALHNCYVELNKLEVV